MNIKTKTFIRAFFAAVILLVNFGSMPGIVYAEEGDGVIDITVDYEILFCNEVTFTISLDDITSPYNLVIDYGDGDAPESKDLDSAEVTLIHTYSEYGVYDLTITVTETGAGSLTGTTSSEITIAGPPAVTLSSPPPPASGSFRRGFRID